MQKSITATFPFTWDAHLHISYPLLSVLPSVTGISPRQNFKISQFLVNLCKITFSRRLFLFFVLKILIFLPVTWPKKSKMGPKFNILLSQNLGLKISQRYIWGSTQRIFWHFVAWWGLIGRKKVKMKYLPKLWFGVNGQF